jgi:hypothetical protein
LSDMTPDQWLSTMMGELSDKLLTPNGLDTNADANAPIGEMTRVRSSLPSKQAVSPGKQLTKQTWAAQYSSDGYTEIFVSPTLRETKQILGSLLHQLVRTAVGLYHNHDATFKREAQRVGLDVLPGETQWAEAIYPTTGLDKLFNDLIRKHGDFPAGSLDYRTAPGMKKQTTRNLAAVCINTNCPTTTDANGNPKMGWNHRINSSRVAEAWPKCASCDEPMEVKGYALPEGEETEAEAEANPSEEPETTENTGGTGDTEETEEEPTPPVEDDGPEQAEVTEEEAEAIEDEPVKAAERERVEQVEEEAEAVFDPNEEVEPAESMEEDIVPDDEAEAVDDPDEADADVEEPEQEQDDSPDSDSSPDPTETSDGDDSADAEAQPSDDGAEASASDKDMGDGGDGDGSASGQGGEAAEAAADDEEGDEAEAEGEAEGDAEEGEEITEDVEMDGERSSDGNGASSSAQGISTMEDHGSESSPSSRETIEKMRAEAHDKPHALDPNCTCPNCVAGVAAAMGMRARRKKASV